MTSSVRKRLGHAGNNQSHIALGVFEVAKSLHHCVFSVCSKLNVRVYRISPAALKGDRRIAHCFTSTAWFELQKFDLESALNMSVLRYVLAQNFFLLLERAP